MPDDLVEPVLRAALHAGEFREPFRAAWAARADRPAGKPRAAVRYDSLHAQKFLPLVRRLHDEGIADHLAGHGHVLVAGQENVKVQLLADAVGNVFMRRGQRPPAGKIALESAVIDADGQIDLALQRQQRGGCRRDRILDPDPGQMLRALPDIHVVGDDADDADAQPVFQHMHARGEADAAAGPADIFADAAGPERIEIAVQIRHAVVEVMVAERHIVVSAAVHDLGKLRRTADRIVAEGPERRTLQKIAAVDDERVAVLLELAGALEQTEVLFFLAAVIRGVDIAVQIGGKVDRQVSFLHSLTPEPA